MKKDIRCTPSFRNQPTMIDYTENNWFKSFWFFIFIQREICILLKDNHNLVKSWLRHKKLPQTFDT